MFEEEKRERTQEFVLRWSGDGGRSYREILRQQYTFSPSGSTREVEDYIVNLQGVNGVGVEDRARHKRRGFPGVVVPAAAGLTSRPYR